MFTSMIRYLNTPLYTYMTKITVGKSDLPKFKP